MRTTTQKKSNALKAQNYSHEPKKQVISMTTTNKKNNNNRKCFSLHPENTEGNKKRIMKENLFEEQQQQHKGHHNRNKSHPKTLPKNKVERSSIIMENKNNSRNYFSLHPKNTDCNKKGVMKENLQWKQKAHHNRNKNDPKNLKKRSKERIIRENKNNRKWFSLHSKNTDCNKKGMMKENLEEEEEER